MEHLKIDKETLYQEINTLRQGKTFDKTDDEIKSFMLKGFKSYVYDGERRIVFYFKHCTNSYRKVEVTFRIDEMPNGHYKERSMIIECSDVIKYPVECVINKFNLLYKSNHSNESCCVYYLENIPEINHIFRMVRAISPNLDYGTITSSIKRKISNEIMNISSNITNTSKKYAMDGAKEMCIKCVYDKKKFDDYILFKLCDDKGNSTELFTTPINKNTKTKDGNIYVSWFFSFVNDNILSLDDIDSATWKFP